MAKITLRPGAQILGTDDGKWVPEVGDRVQVRRNDNDWREVTVVAHDDGGVIYRDPATTDHRYKWAIGGGIRPAPTEEDRAVEEMANMAIPGQGCIGTVAAKALFDAGYRKQPAQPAADMDDPANWRAGDWIECYKSALQLTKGKRYEVLNMVGDDNPVISNDDGEREERYSAVFKHASRP